MTATERHYRVIEKPVVTEKSSDDTADRNSYTFRVPRSANKVEIRNAVEKLFEVKVKRVNTLQVKGKWKIRGRTIGRTQKWKKAMVTLAAGNTIEAS